MKVIRESAEYHFLTKLDKIKQDASGWMGLHFGFSKNLNHADLLKHPAQIGEKLEKARQKSAAFIEGLTQTIENVPQGYFYIFSDQDVFVSLKTQCKEQQARIQKVFKDTAAKLPEGFSDIGSMDKSIYKYQKLADQKMLSAQRFEAYQFMSNQAMVDSIPLRRERREAPMVLIIEDDRFTASYTSNILSKDYDLVIARNGEEGVKAYIEHAPDIVFLDIHLPGMSGHDALQAIKAVDPTAFVVMLSVDTAKESIVQASQTGAKNFLKKPFSRERLLNTVKHSPYVRSFIISETESVH